jgi:hypothetical protein
LCSSYMETGYANIYVLRCQWRSKVSIKAVHPFTPGTLNSLVINL